MRRSQLPSDDVFTGDLVIALNPEKTRDVKQKLAKILSSHEQWMALDVGQHTLSLKDVEVHITPADGLIGYVGPKRKLFGLWGDEFDTVINQVTLARLWPK